MSVLQLSTPSPGRADPISREAVFSEDKRYRYWLSREWDATATTVLICCLNPWGWADHEKDDNESLKLMRWARIQGHGSLVMVSLFALVSRQPRDLERVDDPVGVDNDYYLQAAAVAGKEKGNRLVAAWGRNGHYKHRGRIVLARLAELGCPVWTFGTIADGTPANAWSLGYADTLRPYKVTAGPAS